MCVWIIFDELFCSFHTYFRPPREASFASITAANQEVTDMIQNTDNAFDTDKMLETNRSAEMDTAEKSDTDLDQGISEGSIFDKKADDGNQTDLEDSDEVFTERYINTEQ